MRDVRELLPPRVRLHVGIFNLGFFPWLVCTSAQILFPAEHRQPVWSAQGRCKLCAGLEALKPNRTGCFLSSSFSNATLPLIQCPTLRQSQCLFPQTFGPLACSLRLVHCLTAVHPREALAMLINAVPERAQLSVHTLHPQVGAETTSLAVPCQVREDVKQWEGARTGSGGGLLP